MDGSIVIQSLFIVAFLGTVAKYLVDGIALPMKKKFPDRDLWWLFYVNLAVGLGLGLLARADVVTQFVPTLPYPVGMVVTAFAIGFAAGGAYDLMKFLGSAGGRGVAGDVAKIAVQSMLRDMKEFEANEASRMTRAVRTPPPHMR